MDNKNIAAGLLIFLTFVMLGGAAGIFVGYALCNSVEAEAFVEVQVEDVQNEVAQERKIEEAELQPIELSNLDDIQNVLDIWREIILRTSRGKLIHKEAGKLIYAISSEIYKRNIPEEFCLYRLKNIFGKGHLKELRYSDITYDSENITYVDAVETYENHTYRYRLKFVKENNNWCFAAQLKE